MFNNIINKESRVYKNTKQEIIDYIKVNYSDYPKIEDASILSILFDIMSGINDNLNYYIDYNTNQLSINNATSKAALYDIAKTLGINPSPRSASIGLVDISIDVPVKGQAPNEEYLGVLLKGSQIIGGNNIFELSNTLDFASDYSAENIPNRTITPNVNENGVVVSYTITKQEIVTSGKEKIYSYITSLKDAKKDFFQLTLPDNDVLSIESIIQLDGINYTRQPLLSEWLNPDNQWLEVNNLLQQEVFRPISKNGNQFVGDSVSVDRKFIKEYTANGFCTITFGGSDNTNNLGFTSNTIMEQFFYNMSSTKPFGERLKSNATIFIKYRVGGGLSSNVAVGTLNGFGVTNFLIEGSNQTINTSVRQSLRVTNNVPTFGGKNDISIEELRHTIKFQKTSSGRAVTLQDYYALLKKMPSIYGGIYKLGVAEVDNKINIAVIGVNSSNQLTNTSTSVLKTNIANYLENVKMINDYVQITDGKIINLGVEIDILVNSTVSRSSINNDIIDNITSYFNINNFEMGQNIYISDIYSLINNSSIINIIDVRVFNLVGGNLYSLNQVSQETDENGQIILSENNSIFVNWNEIIELKFTSDIKINFKSL